MQSDITKNKEVAIIGGAGNVGKLLSMVYKNNNFDVTSFSRQDEDVITNSDFWEHNSNRFELIINCAGLLGTENCENNRLQAFNDNSLLPKKIGQAVKNKINIIYISSEAVFGSNPNNFIPDENTDPTPISWYASTKLLGETYTSQYGGKVIRLPLLVDLNNKATLFGKLKDKLQNGEEVFGSTDSFSTPISYASAAEGIYSLSQNYQTLNNINHLTGERYLSVYDILHMIVIKHKFDLSYLRKFDKDVSQNSILDKLKIYNGGLQSKFIKALQFDI